MGWLDYDYDVGKSPNDREQYKRIYTIIEKLACLLACLLACT